MTDEPSTGIMQRIYDSFKNLLTLYHPKTMKERGWLWASGIISVTVFVLMLLLGWYWNSDPTMFDVQSVAKTRAELHKEKVVTGYVATSTLIEVMNTLLNKPGGLLSNDMLPPGIFMDDMPSWEFGVLLQARDFTLNLDNNFSRAQTQSKQNADLLDAVNKFTADHTSWFLLPSVESQYRSGIRDLEKYLHELSDAKKQDSQFYARADNLREWFKVVAKRLGSLSQRLSASVGQTRIDTDLAGDTTAKRSTITPTEIDVKTPWMEIDNVFYEARGSCWALIHLLRAVEVDFKDVLEKKNALRSLQQIIRELEATQRPVWSPMVLNGTGFGFFANYSLIMSSYISRANAGVIELRDLLEKG